MLDTSCYLLLSYIIRITALKTEDSFASHLCIHIAILAIIFPMTGPAGIASQVEHGSIRPGNTSGFGFVSRNAGPFTNQFPVECSRHIDTLGEESTAQRIGGSMYLVYSINTRDTHGFHGFILYLLNNFLPFLFGLGNALGNIQDRAYFILADNSIQQCIVYLELFSRVITFGNDVNGKFRHLANLLFKGHPLKQCLHLFLNILVS